MERVLNVNVGVLGHVDSGKTSLVSALSDILSVAALDKHPQSQERGITLDIGLSAFRVPCPDAQRAKLGVEAIQFTLVDCPGHASLLKTVLGGAQIIDMMLLVVDVTKGIQVQTAECIIIGELLSHCAVVALNKIDLLPSEKRKKLSRNCGRQVLETLKLTRLAAAEIVPVAARVAAQDGINTHEYSWMSTLRGNGHGSECEIDVCAVSDGIQAVGMQELKNTLLRSMPKLTRNTKAPFLFLADHCFQVKGHGTVFSGTARKGTSQFFASKSITNNYIPILPKTGCKEFPISSSVLKKVCV